MITNFEYGNFNPNEYSCITVSYDIDEIAHNWNDFPFDIKDYSDLTITLRYKWQIDDIINYLSYFMPRLIDYVRLTNDHELKNVAKHFLSYEIKVFAYGIDSRLRTYFVDRRRVMLILGLIDNEKIKPILVEKLKRIPESRNEIDMNKHSSLSLLNRIDYVL